MTRPLLHAELLKLITTKRTTTIFLVTSAGLSLLLTLLTLLTGNSVNTAQDVLNTLTSAGLIAALVLLILGAVNMGGESRHGTQVGTFLATPVRWRVVLAKSLVHALAGLVAGALNIVVGLICVALFADAPWPSSGDIVLQTFGSLAGTALYASLGVALGTLLRNQAAVVAGVLVFLLAVEPLLSSFWNVSQKYGISGTAGEMLTAGGANGVAQGVGALVFIAWVVLFTLAAFLVVERRDVRGD